MSFVLLSRCLSLESITKVCPSRPLHGASVTDLLICSVELKRSGEGLWGQSGARAAYVRFIGNLFTLYVGYKAVTESHYT